MRGTRASLTGAQRPSSLAGHRAERLGGKNGTGCQAGMQRVKESHCKVWGRNRVQKVQSVWAYAKKEEEKKTVGKVEGK